MIKSSYPFHFLQNMEDEQHIAKYLKIYRFKSTKSNFSYIVRVEVYDKHVYAIKFYPKQYSNSKNKYRILTNTGEPRRIINTCINIMLSIYEEDDCASFGFIGSNGLDEDGYYNTKRFKIYSHMMATYFDNKVFFHIQNIDKSTYMMVNRKMLEQDPNIIVETEAFFKEAYDYFD